MQARASVREETTRRWSATAARKNWRRGADRCRASVAADTHFRVLAAGSQRSARIRLGTPLGYTTSEATLATNKNRHDGHREGAVRERSQFRTPSGDWAKRDAKTGRILDVKSDGDPFKGVRREETSSD